MRAVSEPDTSLDQQSTDCLSLPCSTRAVPPDGIVNENVFVNNTALFNAAVINTRVNSEWTIGVSTDLLQRNTGSCVTFAFAAKAMHL